MDNVEWGPTLANKALFGFPLTSTISAGSEYPLAAILTFLFKEILFIPLIITGIFFLVIILLSGPGHICWAGGGDRMPLLLLHRRPF